VTTSTGPAIELRGLTKFYGRTIGVEAVTFSVAHGEVTGFLGPNGSGKTTVLRMLVGLISITRGSARVLGLDVAAHGTEIRRSLGYLPGTLAMHKNLSVREYLAFLSDIRGGGHEPHAHELAERLGLRLDTAISGLSKGTKQKVGVVQAFMHQPRVLLLDEPTSGLDPLVQHVFEAILAEARDSGAAVLLSSHVMSEVDQLASHVAVLDRGRLVAMDEVNALKARMTHVLIFEFDHEVDPTPFTDCEGVVHVEARGRRVECTVAGSQAAVLALAARTGAVGVVSSDPDLEDVFLSLTGNGRG